MALKVDILNPKNDIFAVGGAAAIAEHMRSRGGRTFAREFEWWKGRLKAQTRVILEFPSVQAFKIGRRRPNTKNSNQSASRPAKQIEQLLRLVQSYDDRPKRRVFEIL